MIVLAPSILSADFSRLGEQVKVTEAAGARRIHIDVMDGHFVPNLSMGPIVVKGLRPITQLPLEVHLMVEKPEMFLESFSKAGADSLIVHQEVLANPRSCLRQIRALGKKAGLAVNPNHPVEKLEPYLDEMDLALCMTVYPGFGGQPFLPESPARIARLRALIQQRNPQCELEVDGGVDAQTAPAAVAAGANVLVMGAGLFAQPDGLEAATRRICRLLGV